MANFIYKILNPSPKENSRLDPLTTLVKLAILPYKPEGTKLSIDSNYIHYSENTIYQFAVRKYFGDSYNDLRDLNKTLHKAVAWYYDDPNLKYLFVQSVPILSRISFPIFNLQFSGSKCIFLFLNIINFVLETFNVKRFA